MLRHLHRIRSAVPRPPGQSPSLPSALASASSSSSSSSSPSPTPRLRAARPRLPDGRRPFSSSKKDLRESVARIRDDGGGDDGTREKGDGDAARRDGDPQRDAGEETHPHAERFASLGGAFVDTLSQTWQELVASGRPQDINKKLGGASRDGDDGGDDAAADAYEAYRGSTAIMAIDPREELTAWERMQRRLGDAPIIQDILEKSNDAYEKSGAKDKVQQSQQKIQHLREDAEEAWETSQNPWVYRASSVYDTLTAESEFATASRQLRELDPDFSLETWKRDVVSTTLPRIMQLFLEGRTKELKPWLGEAVYNRLAAEGRARRKEGVQMDTNVLAIMNAEILACELAGSSVNVERGDAPVILLHFMCQQIHCVRKKVAREGGDGAQVDGEGTAEAGASAAKGAEETGADGFRSYAEEELGEIVEGSEDDIRANSYVVAFQREYNEEKMELNWKIVDFRFNGAIAYL